MLEIGLVKEVESFYNRNDLTPDLPSMRLVGYRQIWKYLDNQITYMEMQERSIIATRQLAKRQMTWFRNQLEPNFLSTRSYDESISQDLMVSIIKFLQKEKLGGTCDGIIIDMHGEATSEKKAFGYYVDGKVSAVLGTHTHVPTADNIILPKGTAYQTDVGMSGDYNSIIGFDINNPIHGFVKGYRAEGRFTPATENITICGALIDIDINTGLAKNITPIQET